MHELSIAQSLLDSVLEHCRRLSLGKVETVNIRIGRASGIMPDALLFSYDALKEGTAAEASRLTIEEVPVTAFCSDCRRSFTVEEEFVLSCPLCSGRSFAVTGGRELDIIDMEVSDEGEGRCEDP